MCVRSRGGPAGREIALSFSVSDFSPLVSLIHAGLNDAGLWGNAGMQLGKTRGIVKVLLDPSKLFDYK